jgi:hypothetical protein
MEIGNVEIDMNIDISNHVLATFSLLAQDNLSLISFDEAVIEWSDEEKPFSFLFGRQLFNHGLLSTHLISDPLIDFEINGPGIIANFSFKRFSPGIGIAYCTRPDSVKTFAVVANSDISLAKESMTRISIAAFNGGDITMAIGTNLVFGPVTLDAEVFSELRDTDDRKVSGYYCGLARAFNRSFELAARYDGISDDLFTDLYHRIGTGATYFFNNGIFAAIEYGAFFDSGGFDDHEITLEVGISSFLEKAGFQRKTLTNRR